MLIVTIPMEYQRASEQFERFLALARDNAGLSTRNQAYTMVQAVLQTFRRRLTVKQAVAFAGLLPPVLRAIFVAEWDTDDAILPFGDLPAMTLEVQSLRRDHNFSPESSIADVAEALWQVVDRPGFQKFLNSLPEGATKFWAPDQSR
ncbi:DUF2267 domain-containing protein [Bosea rubneri]|uniref:DUF2267 domain-containing protein n=1 Tax=Bosea rubneri TaxID=3075434 RepID=A0ABU3SGQ7_9HYPH|nr:DUF2267 domain-containing protein [Bosea sp. ZW T0_25]MDU0343972.1 DUF2267 domain-containing protein [Bosea sp. ZW T0_25]